MNNLKLSLMSVAVAAAVGASAQGYAAESVTEAIKGGAAYGDFRLRYEAVDQDNALKDADALTLRSRLGYKTGSYEGFSAVMEFEDSRVVGGVDDYSMPGPIAGKFPDYESGYSVIGDPETTELDQAFLQYKSDLFTAKLGRQVLTLDNHRFVGHVGWRQDRQTFDGLTVVAEPVKDLTITYSYLDQRNRIFAEETDVNSKDHLLNVAYKTPIGKLVAYSYMLEEDTNAEPTIDTYGISLDGSQSIDDVKVLYRLEYATQTKDSKAGSEFDADYYLVEGGVVVSGITAKLGYEVLGSDDAAYGFATPLATLHKFNGWADMFLTTPDEGLVDTYLSVASKVGPGNLVVAYHDFTADESTAARDDLGSEVNVSYSLKFAGNYNAGIKYADYSADDFAVDTEKLWVWVGMSF